MDALRNTVLVILGIDGIIFAALILAAFKHRESIRNTVGWALRRSGR